ncbi:hypothetical protein J8L98_11300 [Pseudoalteromonas sp. MMG013]|uniref:hypothetical protein n=1 Tax=Pseudoalteromonas sp. MMG013 TaxID=2822687 RepID=UPI001B38038C|nr:hypothetical protein [Pseudoalteromonas sp. MMG013]MBQ4862274.1 hypothetical protein [Pseudoalteromonas sp. MMG013]
MLRRSLITFFCCAMFFLFYELSLSHLNIINETQYEEASASVVKKEKELFESENINSSTEDVIFFDEKLIQLAYDSEQCHSELASNLKLFNSEKAVLLDAFLMRNDIEESLYELRKANIISGDESISLYKNYYINKEIKRKIVKSDDVLKSQERERLLERNKKLVTLIESNDENSVNTWLESNLHLLDEHFFWRENDQFSIISSEIIFGLYWEKIQQSSRDYFFRTNNLSSSLLYGAIGANVKPENLQDIVDNSNKLTTPLLLSDGHLGDLLTASVLSENIELTIVLKRSGKFKRDNLLTPPANKYIKDKLLANNLTENNIVYLKKLAKHGVVPIVDKKGALLGTGGVQLPIELRHSIEFEIQSTVGNIDREVLLVDEMRGVLDKKEQLSEDRYRCQKLKQALEKIEPKFHSFRPDEYLIGKTANSNAEKVSFLFNISPVLSEIFILDLISKGDTKDFSKIDSSVKNFNEITPEIVQLGNQSLPHEQNYLTYKLYISIGQKALDIAMKSSWYIDFYKFPSQELITGEYHHFLVDYRATGKITPSLLYKSISERSYDHALELIERFPYLNGYKFGRDTFHLFLDRVIPFKVGYLNKEQKVIFEHLLNNTILDKFHYQRLHRLKLKMPIYFSKLTRKYSQLQDVESYEVSRYLGP